MANLRDIRDRISSVQSTQQITKAMKMVAAARLRKAQERMMTTRPYVAGLQGVLEKLSKAGGQGDNILFNQVEHPENVLMIIIGSDRGLCGGFNSNLFRFLADEIDERFAEHKKDGRFSVITVGRKASDYFGKRGYNVVKKYNGFFDNLSFDTTSDIMKEVTEEFEKGTYDNVFIGFNEFKTVISQNRVIRQVLPVSIESDKEEEPQKDEKGYFEEIDYIFEPDPSTILSDIIPLHLNMQLWRAVLESNASEQGARMAAMDNATENAKEIIRVLKLEYNQARQAAITTEISEIVSGAEALSA